MNNEMIFISILMSVIVMGPFNYYGSCLTKISSASHRCTIDSLRSITIWMISLTMGWEKLIMS